MAKRKTNKPNKDAWLGTYGDMITLILVFFVLLYSISTIDEEKYRLLVKAFTADPDTLEMFMREEDQQEQQENLDASKVQADAISDLEEIVDINDLYEYLSEYIGQNDLQDSVQVAQGEDMVYIRFMSTLFFEPDKATLKAGGKDILDDIGPALHMIEKTVKVIRIDGHTAESAPDGNSVNDRDLSSARANEVLKHFEKYHIEDRAKLISVGYGRYRPVAGNDTPEGMEKNRRVEILVSEVDIIQDELDAIYSSLDSTTDTAGEAAAE